MIVWVNVWGWMTKARRSSALFAVLACASGCIDDFDDPKGYGAAGGSDRGGSTRDGCVELCERAASCNGDDELDCKSDCAEYEDEYAAAGCREEFEDLVDCASKLDDICANQDECEASAENLVRCVSS